MGIRSNSNRTLTTLHHHERLRHPLCPLRSRCCLPISPSTSPIPRSAPAPSHAPAPAPYHAPAPAPYHAPAHPVEYAPAPFAFSYGVADDYSKANFAASETSDGKITSGSYQVHLPDGRVQTVTYKADDYSGFVADVKYEGTP